MVLAVAAQPMGLWIGHAVAAPMTDAFSSELYALPLAIRPATNARASLVDLLVAFGSVMLMRRRLDRLDLVAARKSRE